MEHRQVVELGRAHASTSPINIAKRAEPRNASALRPHSREVFEIESSVVGDDKLTMLQSGLQLPHRQRRAAHHGVVDTGESNHRFGDRHPGIPKAVNGPTGSGDGAIPGDIHSQHTDVDKFIAFSVEPSTFAVDDRKASGSLCRPSTGNRVAHRDRIEYPRLTLKQALHFVKDHSNSPGSHQAPLPPLST